MGVHGLWRLIEPSGKPVPLETLENKVLAVDVSIWLHQAIKGFQDSKGAPIPNAHLLGIYHRVCKLLYFKIKPVFVFDGGVPALKKETIDKRNQSRSKVLSEADRIQKQLIETLLKHTALTKALAEKIEASAISSEPKPPKNSKFDMYMLPETSEVETSLSTLDEESIGSSEESSDFSPVKHLDLHNIDMESVHFKSLPADVRHEILTDLKETRKQSSWGRLHELPKHSDDFATYQIRRLLKRQSVQVALESAEKEMGGHSLSLAELEVILRDQGVIGKEIVGSRIASDENKRYLYIKDLHQAIIEKKTKNLKTEEDKQMSSSKNIDIPDEVTSTVELTEIIDTDKPKTIADKEFEQDLEKAIALSLQESKSCSEKGTLDLSEVPSTSKGSMSDDENLQAAIEMSLQTEKPEYTKQNFLFLEDTGEMNFESSSEDEVEELKKKVESAKNYMMEYSGLTPAEIAKIINSNNAKKVKENVVESTMYSKDVKDLEEVEIMSISSSGSELNDFIEITSNTNEKHNTNSFEIIVDPDERVEEDLFSDIFEKSTDVSTTNDDTSQSNKKPKIKETQEETSAIQNSDIKCDKNDSISDVIPQKEIVIKPKPKISIEELQKMKKELQQEKNELLIERSTKERMAGNITEQMMQEVQIASAFQCRILTGAIINLVHVDAAQFLQDCAHVAKTKLKKILKDMGPVKMHWKFCCKYFLPSTLEEDFKYFVTKNKEILNWDEQYLESVLQDLIETLMNKELLELFGVPYVVAPMEAEAQCAFLDRINLTNGTITDDSDIWLFGGNTVYKNFFNQSKYVMEFKAENVRHNFKLGREQMILLALLVGSDYTMGIQGIGPVTALEVLAAFPPPKTKMNEFSLSHMELLSGLREFRSWFTKGKAPGPGRTSLRSKLKNVSFLDSFPSLKVVQAYLEPTVETSREKFSWSKPDVGGLIQFAREKFGWTRKKSEGILMPVLNKLADSKTQKTIKDYFKTTYNVDVGISDKAMSKRVKTALENMDKDPSEIITENLKKELKPKKSGKPKIESADRAPKTKRTKSVLKEKTSDDKFKDDCKKVSKKQKKDLNTRVEVKDSKFSGNKEPPSNSIEKVGIDEPDTSKDVLEKIQKIRTRRRVNMVKAKILQKEKLEKEKTESNEKPSKPSDEEIFLYNLTEESQKRASEIESQLKNEISKTLDKASPSKSIYFRAGRKDFIPQKERNKSELLRNKLKAIEVFRKSRKGPGFVEKRNTKKRLLKEDAGLSESSSDE